MDAIPLASRRATHIEIAEGIELIALLRRQPGLEQPQPASFRPVLLTGTPK
jgi:hypothetical protein